MKKYIFILFFMMSLTSCFKDEGNYKYHELNAPHWMKNYSNSPLQVKTRYDANVIMDGSSMFVWDKDSLKRANEVRYEWVFNGVVVSEDIRLDIPAAEFMEKAGIEKFSTSTGNVGTFNIIEKETGVTYMAKVSVWLYSYYAPYDWFILSEGTDGSTDVSSIRRLTALKDGELVWDYRFESDIFQKANNNKEIPGKPLRMNWSKSLDFGAQGCITVITSEVAYQMNAENFKYVSDMKDDFIDGKIPAGFKPVNRVDINPSGSDYPPCTVVASEDGKIYTRVQSKNYLGGKFLTEAYEIDDKGYDITMFGNSRYGGTIPCYDAKNQRVVMANVWGEQLQDERGYFMIYRTKLTPIPADQNGSEIIALNRIAREGAEVLHLSAVNHSAYDAGNTTELYTAYFNRKEYPNSTFAYDFCVDNRGLRPRNPWGYYAANYVEMPFNLTKDNIILVTVNGSYYAEKPCQRTLFTYNGDNKLHYMQRTAFSTAKPTYHTIAFPDGEGVTGGEFPAKITAMAYDYFYCDLIMVGLENGDVYYYNIDYIETPELICKGNVGGKVISFKQLGERASSHDNF